MSDEAPVAESEARLAAREFFAAALYMALVLLAVLVTVPTEKVPSDATTVGVLFGSAIGLTLAHWLAFGLAAHLTEEGGFAAESAAREAGAQVAGGLVVAAIASLPFLLLDGETAVRWALILLAAMPALAGLGIARIRRASWLRGAVVAVVVLVVAAIVVVIKVELGH